MTKSQIERATYTMVALALVAVIVGATLAAWLAGGL
jgi:hypothetical protein